MSRYVLHGDRRIDELLVVADLQTEVFGVVPLDVEAELMADGVFLNPLQDYTEE